jgi:hypothetical protein
VKHCGEWEYRFWKPANFRIARNPRNPDQPVLRVSDKSEAGGARLTLRRCRDPADSGMFNRRWSGKHSYPREQMTAERDRYRRMRNGFRTPMPRFPRSEFTAPSDKPPD